MPRDTVLANLNLIDGTGAKPRTGMDLTISGGLIFAIGRSGSAPAEGARVIDMEGGFAVPGLIDAHVHLTSSGRDSQETEMRRASPTLLAIQALAQARRSLASGFTTVRDAGAMSAVAIDVGRAQAEGLVEGPAIYASGNALSISGGHGDPQNGFPQEVAVFVPDGVVDSPDAARKFAREEIRRGAKAVKLLATGGVLSFGDSPHSPGLTEEEMRAAVEAAHHAGVPVLAHAQGTEGIKNAIRAGVDSIDHGIYLDAEGADMMAERGVCLVPTLSAVEQIIDHASDRIVPAWAAEKARRARDAHWNAMSIALSHGVTVVLGTDAGTPFNYHGENAQEMRHMIRAGLSPMQAIMAGTAHAAKLIGSPAGVLESGRPADLLVTGGNPLEDIDWIVSPRRLRLVIQAGRVVRRGARG